jgi:hypothetical protein
MPVEVTPCLCGHPSVGILFLAVSGWGRVLTLGLSRASGGFGAVAGWWLPLLWLPLPRRLGGVGVGVYQVAC